MVKVENIIGSGSLEVDLDLNTLGDNIDIPIYRYDPEIHYGAYLRFKEEGSLITVYNSGKYIIRASSFDELHNVRERFLKLFKYECFDSEVDSFSVKNVVCTADLEKEINLDKLAIKLQSGVEYEPEQFPGLIYRPKNHKCTILIFTSGKIVITGAQSKKIAKKALKVLKNKILN